MVAIGYERFVVDGHEFDRVLRGVTRSRDHHRDSVAHEAYPVDSQRIVHGVVEAGEGEQADERIGERRDVGPREHGHHAGHTPSGFDVHAADERVRVGAARERCVQHVGHCDVVDVASHAREEPRVLDPPDLPTDEPTCDRFAHRVASLGQGVAPAGCRASREAES